MAEEARTDSMGRPLMGVAKLQAAVTAGEGATCNALLQRGNGAYCKLIAGIGTDHVGEGNCYLHGGKPAATNEANEAVPVLSERINKLTKDDTEALMSMGTKAMVLARARMMQRLLQPEITTKEMQDITSSVARLDGLLAKHPDIEDPDAAPNTNVPSHLDDELKRLIALDK